MKYKILFEKNADKQLKKIDTIHQKIIVSWIGKNLENINDLRNFGKSLKGNLKEYWRCRVGDYRIIAEINDDEVKIIIIDIEHKRGIYKKI